MTYFTEKTIAADREADQRAMRAQQREAAARMLVDEVCRLLNDQSGTLWLWTGSSADLMEALHTAYLLGDIYGDDGQPRTFADIVGRACLLLGVSVPRNPSARAARAARRKGVRKTNFFERYCRMYRDAQAQTPLRRMMRRR